ncbi:MAG: PKD domain-containing protein, partial [Candidatus Magnetoovum sp. WYHC-5]|nr:PKD domain-containing protein [Candidatus Magnetoovum sp. WYHC-5]
LTCIPFMGSDTFTLTVSVYVLPCPSLIVAINVDNIPVYVSGNQWVSPEFKLDEGANNITATISDGQGNTYTDTVSVNVSLPINGIQVRVSKGNGLSPLKAYFDVDEKLLYSVVLYEIDFDGDGTYDYSGSELTDPFYTYTAPGIYYPKATVTDEQGNKYTDNTLIAVLDRVEVDSELKNRWQTMKNAMVIKDISSALQYFTSDYQPLYGRVFAALLDNLPQYAAGMRGINLIYCENDTAKFHIEKQEVIAGEVHNISYFIYFVRDIDGFWKIYRF